MEVNAGDGEQHINCRGVHPMQGRSALLHINLGGGVQIRDKPINSTVAYDKKTLKLWSQNVTF